MNNTTQLYTVTWQQPWPEWQQLHSPVVESEDELEDFTEANEIIEYIMRL